MLILTKIVKFLKSRIFYQIDDFILLRKNEIERLDVIFIHKLSIKSREFFAQIIHILKDFVKNIILKISMFRCAKERIMIKLSAIVIKKLYIISMQHRKNSDDLCLNNND